MRDRDNRKQPDPRDEGPATRDITKLIGLAILAIALFFIAIGIATA